MKNRIAFFSINLWFLMQIVLSFSNTNVSSEGIFDIQNEVEIKSLTSNNLDDEDGISTYNVKRKSPSLLEVSYTYERKEIPNPLFVNYSFEIRKFTNGDYEMDMVGAMPYLSMYIGDNVETFYNGTHLKYPNTLTLNKELPAAKGEFTLQFKTDKRHLLSYQVEVKDRKIIRKETLLIDEESYEAYVHTYLFIQKTKLNNGVLNSTLQHNVEEWLIPNYGIVKQDRKETVIIASNDNTERSIKKNYKSELLTIK